VFGFFLEALTVVGGGGLGVWGCVGDSHAGGAIETLARSLFGATWGRDRKMGQGGHRKIEVASS